MNPLNTIMAGHQKANLNKSKQTSKPWQLFQETTHHSLALSIAHGSLHSPNDHEIFYKKFSKKDQKVSQIYVNGDDVGGAIEIPDLEPGVVYSISARGVLPNKGRTKASEYVLMKTKASCPPPKPKIHPCENDTVKVTWEEPKIVARRREVSEYRVKLLLGNSSEKVIKVVGYDTIKEHMFKVDRNGWYCAQVQAIFPKESEDEALDESLYSDESDTVQMDYVEYDLIYHLKMQSQRISDPNKDPEIYHISSLTDENVITESSRTALEEGRQGKAKATPLKFVFLGASQSGKSTAIDSMVNYLLGIELIDEFRFVLTPTKKKKEDKIVKTDVTSCMLEHQSGFQHNHSFMFIETPGLTMESKEVDGKIKESIGKYLLKEKDIDCAILLITAFQTRLTAEVRFILDTLKALLPSHVPIRIFVTFADGEVPPALEMLSASGLGHHKTYTFNNGSLLHSSKKASEISKHHWENNTQSFKMFFAELDAVKSREDQDDQELKVIMQRIEKGLASLETAGILDKPMVDGVIMDIKLAFNKNESHGLDNKDKIKSFVACIKVLNIPEINIRMDKIEEQFD